MVASKKEKRAVIDTIFILLGSAAAVMFMVAGCLGWYAYHFATTTVHDELASQKVYFPPAGSAALNPREFPDLQKYGAQLVDDGPKAKAYANGFIGRHLDKVANGMTYSEVSALAMKDPGNQKLAAQKATLFQGETLRGLLLGDGYAYWTMGQIARYAAIAAFAGAAIMAVLVALGLRHMRRL
jgi:hypothetical protein